MLYNTFLDLQGTRAFGRPKGEGHLLRAARREASQARREARAAGRARREAGAVVLAALRDVRSGAFLGGPGEKGEARGGGGGAAGASAAEATSAASATNDSAPLSYSSLTPRQKEAALQLLFSRLRDVVFVPGRRRSRVGGGGGGE